MVKKFVILSLLFLLSTFLFPISSSAQSLVVKEGKPCNLIDSVGPYKFKVDRLYSWDTRKKKFFNYRCVRTDVIWPDGTTIATCGQAVKAKFIRKDKSPECVWKVSLNSKTKKPVALEIKVIENQNCLDAEGHAEEQFIYLVKNEQLSVYFCFRNPGVWELFSGPGLGNGADNSNYQSPVINDPQRVGLANACSEFANVIIDYNTRGKSTRLLFPAKYRLLEFIRTNNVKLNGFQRSSLISSINIITAYTFQKFSVIQDWDEQLFRWALEDFNSYCGTSIYIPS